MHKQKTLLVALGAILVVSVSALADFSMQAALTSECVGKPYGSPGCPLKAASSSSVSTSCGNAEIDPGEECDLGATRNGSSNCTKGCKLLYCGDGLISPALKEECEPESQEVYGLDDQTGELIIETQYLAPSCGAVCSVPVCNAEGLCAGGCKYTFLPACSTISSQSSSAKQTVSDDNAQIVVKAEQVSPGCGNGVVDSGEQCDDGNRTDEDSCSNLCRQAVCGDKIVQAWEQCDDGNLVDADSCSNACKSPACGDGVTQSGEQCDDGNFIDTDSCTSACKIPICGDRIMQQTLGEQCDDGNSIDNDNCTNFCKRPVCGDGVLQTGEQCDDGNRNNFDACTNECVAARCGDAVLQDSEECDDGNRVNHDGCNNLCKLPECGNGIREGDEVCDDGNEKNNDACTNQCTRSECGDGFVQAGEFCDDGNQDNNDNCTVYCRVPTCGDGLLHPREECDEGRLNSDTKPNACRTDCRVAICGDGVIDNDSGEECDGGDACSPECRLLKAAAPVLTEGTPTMPLVIGLGIFGLLAVVAYAMKKQLHHLVSIFAGENFARSIDDVPLDQIEMPWLKKF